MEMDGNIRDLILPSEITLNIGISTAKAINRMSASQKLGTHIPIMQITLVAWSNALSFHMTENADIKTVKIATQSIDIITNIHVTGSAFLILSMTGVKAKLFCPEIAGLFCRIAGLFCHDSRANLSLKPVCFGIAIS